jgi:hypothetical protein
MFIPPRLSYQPDAISLGRESFHGDFMSPATIITRTEAFIQRAGHFVPISTKFGFSRHTFTEVPDIKFHGNLKSGSRADTCGQKDGRSGGHDEANRSFS